MGTGNCFAEQKEAGLQPLLDHQVFDVVNESVADKVSSDESSMGVDVEVHWQRQGAPLGFQEQT